VSRGGAAQGGAIGRRRDAAERLQQIVEYETETLDNSAFRQ
jgi:hypothetical protein